MADKLTPAQAEQARIVADQEEAQSVPPYPSQAQIDRARLGLTEDEPVEKAAEADTAPAGYKTRATKSA